MKFMKVFVITLLALFLTGCYTQLQYSQSMKKITDREKKDNTPAYSWSGEEQADSLKHTTNEEVAKAEKQEEYIPVYYKDYKYATKYGDVYNFYGNDWYRQHTYPYSRFYSWHPFSYDRWAYHSFYGRWYDRPHYGLSFSLSWGWPRYHYGYYDPFYDPYYDYYWHRYYSRYAYGYWNFYGKSGYGHGYYPDKKVREDRNVRYGPRSIGTNRVVTDGTRSRSVNSERSATVRNQGSTTVRTRSTGTTRTRGTKVDRSSSKERGSSGTTRKRTRDNVRIDDSSTGEYNYRSRGSELPIVIDEEQLKRIRARANATNNNRLLNRARMNNSSNENSTFFNRMRSFFDNNDIFKKPDRNRSTWRTRSNFPTRNRGTVNRSSSSNNRSSVTRSKSSSNNSRSRGSSSSSSRSRSGGSSSDSGSDRSRGN